MRRRIASLAVAAALLAAPPGIGAQDVDRAMDVYHEAVARFFEVAPEEVRILAGWQIQPQEIPVVLFLSAEAGISPDAAASARTRGSTWQGLMQRYGVQVSTLHLTIASGAPLGALESVHRRMDETPRNSWNRLPLSDDEIVGLINLRVISTALRVSPPRVLEVWQLVDGWHRVPLALANSR